MSYRVRYYVLGEEDAEEGIKTLKQAILWALALWDSTEGLPFAIERGEVPAWRVEHSENDRVEMAMFRRQSFERFAFAHGCLGCVPSEALPLGGAIYSRAAREDG